MAKAQPEYIEFPTYSDDLVKLLDELYPEKMPEPTETYNEILVKIGQRQVVRFLLSLKNAQQGELERQMKGE